MLHFFRDAFGLRKSFLNYDLDSVERRLTKLASYRVKFLRFVGWFFLIFVGERSSDPVTRRIFKDQHEDQESCWVLFLPCDGKGKVAIDVTRSQ